MRTEQLCDERLITEFGKKRYSLFLNITSQTQARFCYNFYFPNVFFYFREGRERGGMARLGYCNEGVCVFVCPRSYLRNCTSDLRQIFCACYLWPWLGPPPTESPAEAQCTRSLGLGYKLCAVIPFVG